MVEITGTVKEKKIKGFPEYSIDNQGNIYSFKSGKKVKMKGSTTTKGYRFVKLSNKQEAKQFYIHRLVAKAFVRNSKPKTRTEVNHKDGDRANNVASNLEWCTHDENQKHSYDMGRLCNFGRIRRIYDVNTLEVYRSQHQMMNSTGISQAVINKDLLNNKGLIAKYIEDDEHLLRIKNRKKAREYRKKLKAKKSA